MDQNLIIQGDARVINVSSDGHKFTMLNGLDVDHPRYINTKLAAGYKNKKSNNP